MMNRAIRIAASLAITACAWNVHAEVLWPDSPSGTSASLNPEFLWEYHGFPTEALPRALSYNVLVQDASGVAIYENVDVKGRCGGGYLGGLVSASCSIVFDTPLTNGATYSWRIQPVTAAGPGEWTGSLEFTVNQSMPVPGPVAILMPEPGSTAPHSTIAVAWTPATGATRYRVYEWNEMGELINRYSVAGKECALQCWGLLGFPRSDNTPYTFRVTPYNAGGNGPTSGPHLVTARYIPKAPSWYTFFDGTPYYLRPTYSWAPSVGATSYSLQVIGPGGMVFAETYSPEALGCAPADDSGYCQVAPRPVLKSGTLYTARVASINSIGQSDFAVMTFTTLDAPPPVAPESPAIFEVGVGYRQRR
jgi:hypothetical protein